MRLLKIDEFGVLVSDGESDAFPLTQESAIAHAAVVRSVFDQTTSLPFRFGTIIERAAAPALRHDLQARFEKALRTYAAASRWT